MNMKIYKNPIPEEFAEISEAVKANEGYCPCLLTKDDDTKCMCKDFRDSTETDFCHCGRYYKVKEFEWIALVGDVSTDDGAETFGTWMEMLAKQNFIVLPVDVNQYNPFHLTTNYSDLLKAKINAVDAVIFLDNEAASDWMIELETWATALGKKIIHRSDLQR